MGVMSSGDMEWGLREYGRERPMLDALNVPSTTHDPTLLLHAPEYYQKLESDVEKSVERMVKLQQSDIAAGAAAAGLGNSFSSALFNFSAPANNGARTIHPSNQFVLEPSKIPEDIKEGVLELASHFPSRFVGASNKDAWPVSLVKVPSIKRSGGGNTKAGYSIKLAPMDVTVEYTDTISAFRALGWLLGEKPFQRGSVMTSMSQRAFDSQGILLDVSRNAVLKVDTIKFLLRHMALSGVNQLFLYLEDTYELMGEPFFGYMRGRYSWPQLNAIDVYARNMGIEVVPTIQTLGHLENLLQWPDYEHIKDTDDVLLTEYQLLDKMVKFLSTAFKSSRIHVGMDEAHGVGTGKSLALFGCTDPSDVIARHLTKVLSICNQYNKRPMMWGDMFFRLASPTRDYYDTEHSNIPKLVKAVRVLWRLHHLTWLSTNKPFGMETLEQRYGGLLLRLDSLRFRLQAFVDGEVAEIPELEEKLLKIYTVDITKSDPQKSGGWPVFDECHARTVTAASPMQARRYCWP